MGWPKNAPVFDIDEERLAQIKKENAPVVPKAETKYKPGTIYLTKNYPGHEGSPVFLGISDSRRGDGGMVRVTGVLPAIPARAEQRLEHCPGCNRKFKEGVLVIPGYSETAPVEIDHTYRLDEFEKLLVDWKATVHGG